MYDYYLHYHGPNKTEPVLYRVSKATEKVTFSKLAYKVMYFLQSSSSKEYIERLENNFYKLI